MTPLEAAWEHYGGTLLTHREGRNKARCPLHDDANASATVNIADQRWKCFAGCGYGDIYELVKLADDIGNFRANKEYADQKFGTHISGSITASRRNKKRKGNSWT